MPLPSKPPPARVPSLVFTFIFSMLLKFDELTESVRPVLSESMLGLFDFPVANLTFGLFASVVSALSCLSIVAAQQIAAAARKPIIRLKRTRETPYREIKLPPEQQWHLFL